MIGIERTPRLRRVLYSRSYKIVCLLEKPEK